MGKMRKKHLWSKFVNQHRIHNENDTPPQVFQSRIFFIGCTHTKDVNV